MLVLAACLLVATGATAPVVPIGEIDAPPPFRAGLVITGAGATMFWAHRVSEDATTPGREAEAARMIDGRLPIGGVGALVLMAKRGVLLEE